MAAAKTPRSRPGLIRRSLRWIAILVLVALVGVIIILVTTPGGRMLATTINRLGSGPSQSIEIDRIDGLLSGTTRIGHVILSDASGEPWLLLKGITIDWSPLALLSSTLDIEALTIDRVELARLPQGAEDADESGALVLPVAFDIKRFSAMDIVVGAPVAGRVARFEASGRATVNATLSTAMADLALKRTDGVGGELTLDADYDETEDRFNISAALSEPAGGVMANLLRLSPDDAISVTATSQGSLSDWQLSANGLVNDEIVADAMVQLTASEAGEALTVQAGGLFEKFLPPSLSQIVAGRSDLLLEALLEPERTGAVIDIFTFSSGKLSAEGRGRVAREGEVDLTLQVSPQPGAGSLSFGEGEARVSLSVPEARIRVTGTAEEAALRLELTTDRVTGSAYSADDIVAVVDFDRFSLATRSGTGLVDMKIGAVGSSNDILARAVAGGVTLSGNVALAEDGTISSDRILVQTGVAEVGIDGLSYGNAGALQASLAGTIRNAVLSAQAPELLGPDTAFKGEVALDEAGALTVRDFQLTSEFMTASGGVALSGEGEIAGDIEANVADLSGFNDAVSGGITLSATVSGQSAAPAFEARIAGQSLSVEGRDLSDLVLEARGVADPAAPQADVTLTGTLEGRPIDGSVVLAQADGVVRIDPLRLQVADNLISGTLVLDEAYRPTGVIELDLKDIGSLSALALQTIKGSGGGTIRFAVVDNESVADIALGFPELSDAGFSVRDARLTASIADLMGTPEPVGTLDVAALSAGGTDVSGLAATFSQVDGWTVIDGKAQAAGFPVAIEARLRQGDAGIELEVETARTSYQGLAINLTEPARVVVEDGTARIEQLTISPGGGEVSVSGTAGQALNLDLAISGLPLTSVNAVAPGAGLSGTVSGQVRVRGTGSAPVISYDLTASNVRAAAASAVADVPLSLTANGDLKSGRLSFNAQGNGNGLAFTASGGLDTGGARALSANINGSVPFSILSAQLARQGIALTGAAQADISISGSVGAPQISGTITTSGSRLVDSRTGIAITDLAADIGLTSGQANIRSLSGVLPAGGRISGSGSVGLDAAASYPADLQLKVERGRYADGKMVATRFDADLALTGPLTGLPSLAGTVALDETTITVPDTIPSSIAQLNVTHENASSQVQSQAERLSGGSASGASSGLGLDVQVQASRLFVRGRGMDVELGGSIRLTGTTGAPVAAGGFDLRRGRLSILGQRLNFDSGKLGFAGSVVPILDLSASTRSGSTTVTVRVTGPADAPEFSFTSSPELPEDEVLAQLVFGRSLSSLSPLQIAQLAEAVGQLTGAVTGGGLVERLRRATGVDDIDVRTDEETGDTSVGVGKYLNDRTYLGIESGGSAGDGKARIDLDIGRGIKLRGEAGTDGETKGGIFFEREY
ncbi:MAG: translocation/assembly module TamB domain-containing protein [Hoeflea sp.]|uniref:translocation/assembly module TamB domain-containing protein n=1 Tax=Hoeflea sp. TaxID=1940281 RepID=UPI001D245AB3|nr:translocation/assembly module TamB domain-containing protein [Hoeflea sp.]MBU4530272.1 translocation/assembly module TamB domain-containing protein [Alphaproteobacteria bacterium]MBU4545059.1 translocation/assembly module TamB domain-containing protein [Alphaproteobacteria bacterium]MBU4549741.1 translocation/assembly module TamB domain-containing protein [Alphaproteobacteria bacterium]MBV1721862.1 translocation/assembly module TamB domain-containing protein [Hoeflea sp.]MBV1761212.1 transl